MLVLSRKRNEQIVIGENIVITVTEIRGDKVRLGIEAPKEVPVHRREIFDAIQEAGASGEIPCCRCKGHVVEFSVSNEAWNTIVRRNGPETDQEYLCLECFAGLAVDEIEQLRQEAATPKTRRGPTPGVHG